MSGRREDRELHWRGVVARQAESGQSVAAFCRQESISAPSFYAWRRKLRGGSAPKSGPENGAPNFLPVRIESKAAAESVRILLPHGVAIDAPGGLDGHALAELLGALRAAQLC